jgi:hypothetical protein
MLPLPAGLAPLLLLLLPVVLLHPRLKPADIDGTDMVP